MQIPDLLSERIDEIVSKLPPSVLKSARLSLSENYRQSFSSDTVFSNEAQSLAYLATRMPATFAANCFVLKELQRQIPEIKISSVLDLGAGPATATFAAYFTFETIQKADLLERNLDAIKLGKKLLTNAEIPTINWHSKDITTEKVFPPSDLCIVSYSIGELSHLEKMLQTLLLSQSSYIAIIEPGTPLGYQKILKCRTFFLKNGYNIVAPCPHRLECPIKGNDWCHFSTRLDRTKLHRMLKEGSLGYEDEKFSYLVVSKNHNLLKNHDRVLRHPFKGSGHIKLQLCTHLGQIQERVITKKTKELYKTAKELTWGDSLENTAIAEPLS